MTYKERQKQLCEQCSERCKEQACGYVIRNLQDDCSHLRVIMYGWKLGQQDTIEEIEAVTQKFDGFELSNEKIRDLIEKIEQLKEK